MNYFGPCTSMEAQGYTVNADGERIIAASRRPDGTLRKERRVKPGYVPQDEQPVYQPRGAVVGGLLPVVVCLRFQVQIVFFLLKVASYTPQLGEAVMGGLHEVPLLNQP